MIRNESAVDEQLQIRRQQDEEFVRKLMKREEYKRAFRRYDINGDGRLDLWEIRRVMEDVGLSPTDEELQQITSAIDQNDDGSLDFEEFCAIMEKEDQGNKSIEEQETLEAYVALGGGADKSGCVDAEKIKKVISDFGLTIEIDELLAILDTDGSGEIEFDEFKELFVSTEADDILPFQKCNRSANLNESEQSVVLGLTDTKSSLRSGGRKIVHTVNNSSPSDDLNTQANLYSEDDDDEHEQYSTDVQYSPANDEHCI